MSLVEQVVKKIVELLESLEPDDSLTNGEITELIEYLTAKQQMWEEDMSGYKVIEALKELVRQSKEDDGDGRNNL